jgi:hypothetical protein
MVPWLNFCASASPPFVSSVNYASQITHQNLIAARHVSHCSLRIIIMIWYIYIIMHRYIDIYISNHIYLIMIWLFSSVLSSCFMFILEWSSLLDAWTTTKEYYVGGASHWINYSLANPISVSWVTSDSLPTWKMVL